MNQNVRGGKMKLLSDLNVFDAEHIPEVVHFRDRQISALLENLEPALRGSSPVNTLLVGPPSTGKTCVLQKVLGEFRNCHTAYVRCQLADSTYRIMARVFETVCGHQAPQTGYPLVKIYDAVCERLIQDGRALILALDDVSEMSQLNKVLEVLLKADEEYGVRIGVVLVSNDVPVMEFPARAVLQADVIHFPLYSLDEMRVILADRARRGLGRFDAEVIDAVANVAFRHSDLRLGIKLLRKAGMIAEKRKAMKVELEDVERACSSTQSDFHFRNVLALRENERAVLKEIYLARDSPTTGEVYEAVREKMGYTTFFEILEKLERLRFIDLVYARKGRGNTRLIYRKYNVGEMLRAIEAVGLK